MFVNGLGASTLAHAGSSQPACAGGSGAGRTDADLTFEHTDRQRAGVFIGTGMGGAQATDDGYFTVIGHPAIGFEK